MLVTTEAFDISVLQGLSSPKPGSAIFSPSYGGYLFHASNPSFLPGAGAMSIVVRARLFSFPPAGSVYTFANVSNGAANQRCWNLDVNGTKPRLRLSADGATSFDLTDANSPPFVLNQWSQVAGGFDGLGTSFVALDAGVPFTSSSTPHPLFASTAQFRIGSTIAGTGATFVVEAEIRDVMLWNRQLSPAELTELRNGGQYLSFAQLTPGLLAGLVHAYQLDQAPGGLWPDLGPGNLPLSQFGDVRFGAGPFPS